MLQCRPVKGLQRCCIVSGQISRCLSTRYIPVAPFRRSTATSIQARFIATDSSINLIEDYKRSLSFPTFGKQDDISKLRFDQLIQGQTVTLHGYLGHLRTPSKNLAFVEFYGPELDASIQLVSVARITGQSNHELIKQSRAWTPVVIKGQIKPKSVTMEREREKGDVPNEIELLDVQVLNRFPSDINASASFGPDQRHLQLKSNTNLRQALHFRSKLYHAIYNRLIEQEYQHIETPLLFKSTSEGAREFLVPTRRDGLAYALPQSPQQYKQLLMASGIPKYFQIARCFRDEDMRADRQPEFTQLDLERAFVSGENIMSDVENLVKRILQDVPIPYGESSSNVAIQSPFKIHTYQEVMSRYGIDKPDLRLDHRIAKIDHLLPADLVSKISPLTQPAVDISVFKSGDNFNQDPLKVRTFVTEFLDSPQASVYHNNPDGGPGIFIYDSQKPLSGLQAFGFEAAEEIERIFEPEEGDLIVLQARPNVRFSGGSTALGRFMIDLNRSAVEKNLKTLPPGLEFLWVIDFPLFTPISTEDKGQSGLAGLQSTHHPFTSPKTSADVDLLFKDPEIVIADHYDLVVNGVEVGGGSRRIHNADMQRLVMEQILKMPKAKIQEFDHLLEALRAGCPPHAGFALGLDRFVAVLLGKESVRHVIAFPKWGKGDDPMVKAPSKVDASEWNVYNLEPKTC